MTSLEGLLTKRLDWSLNEAGWTTEYDGQTLQLELRDAAPWWRMSSGDAKITFDEKPALWHLQGTGLKALVVYCHPRSNSFTSAVRDVIVQKLEAASSEIKLIDLYADGFDPVLSPDELQNYLETPGNVALVPTEVDAILWCNTLIFVYPTWWYGLPAMLKGWLDRALLPDVAFLMPDEHHKDIRPGLPHITRLGVFTTCGASRWLTMFIGAPGKRTLMRGVGLLCAKPLKKAFAAHYLMDSSTEASRKAHLDRVAATMDRFLK